MVCVLWHCTTLYHIYILMNSVVSVPSSRVCESRVRGFRRIGRSWRSWPSPWPDWEIKLRHGTCHEQLGIEPLNLPAVKSWDNFLGGTPPDNDDLWMGFWIFEGFHLNFHTRPNVSKPDYSVLLEPLHFISSIWRVEDGGTSGFQEKLLCCGIIRERPEEKASNWI